MAMTLPWLRLYAEAVDDEKLRLLAFEDRWHFIALLCLKQQGILDTTSDPAIYRRKMAVKMDVQPTALDEILRRLSEIGLIDVDDGLVTIRAWEQRQFLSDSSSDRVRRHRNSKKINDF